jgi:hypothetical protein
VPNRTANQSFQPTTFLERGASVSFTTPVLAGARVRPADRFGLELIVPNPSGGRGEYILPWTGLRSICRPTVHDIQLTEQIAGLRGVTPASIRNATRHVASQGLAGRAAISAASSALAEEEESRVYTNFELLLRLVQQAELPGTSTIRPEDERPAALEQRARRVITQIAPQLRQDNEMIGVALEDLATLFNPVGVGARATRARLPHALASLKLMRKEMLDFPLDLDDQVPGLVQMVVATANMTVECVDVTLGQARALADNLLDLLGAWRTDPAGVSRQLTRTDWLMDGWERICRLWSRSEKIAARRDALDEIGAMLPIIPREAGEWVGFHIEIEAPRRTHRLVTGHEDWRTGHHVQDMIARNEALLAGC